MNKNLVMLGSFIILIGFMWPVISKIPFGQLPGDFTWKGKNFSFFFPLASGLILSALFSFILWFISYFK